MVFTSFLNPILGPFLLLNPLLAIIILSFFISLLVTLIYKYATDQNMMKQLKDEIKEFQKQIKELRDRPEEAMKIQKEAMKTNLKYMSMSMKATIITFIPIIFIFGWMSAHFAYDPIRPGDEFTVTLDFKKPYVGTVELVLPPGVSTSGGHIKEISGNNVLWVLSAKEGEHLIDILADGKSYATTVVVSSTSAYGDQTKPFKSDDVVKRVTVDYKKKIVLNLLGWKLGWLGSYIIFSIAFSLGLRKLLSVY